ncbi:ATP-binding protein [Rubripirellula amarantea]|uniref:histidine kinase n=1 Tax=Rubripirellula amarantea TaxID=2527999 RepID=A0A5C5WR85_9BACT|nr:ATP-binding protein [Rubripirellula amarantea]MDA8746484.1 ATP-binding protein [Rubripirellula amarantea]TWT52755.1 Phytochrome-like protein cph1 [Rubripirellula amarantea]
MNDKTVDPAFTKTVLQRAIHDLRAPLRHVLMHCEIFAEETAAIELNPEAEKAIEDIQLAVQRSQSVLAGLTKLVQHCWDEPTREATDIRMLIAGVWQSLEDVSPPDAKLSFSGEWPSLWIDEQQIGSVFTELFGNSIRYRDEKQTLDIKVACSQKLPSAVTISLSDNGLGVNPKYANQLTAPFGVLPQSDVKVGPGVGLALAQRIIERHGGSLAILAARGHGLAIEVNLPTGPAG